MQNYPRITLKSGRDSSIKRFHPWVFSGAVKNMDHNINEGDIVEVYDNNNNYLATGHYQPSSIVVLIISFQQQPIDSEFWKGKIAQALKLREMCGYWKHNNLNVFRLIHGEGDGMPGLIADFYNGVLVFQAHSLGMYLIKEELAEIFNELLGKELKAIYNKSAASLPYKAPIEKNDGFIYGAAKETEVNEYGKKFLVDFKEGQKTGFFVDQRENRELLGRYSAGKNVLNMFCYSGGFSVAALKGGATKITSIDSSQKAIDMATQNMEINKGTPEKCPCIATDGFKYLEKMKEAFDIIILDPPAFAKHNKVLNQALKGYRRLNRMAMEKIKPGGILFTYSCSQVVTKENFRNSIFTAATQSKKQVSIIGQVSQPADHPVNVYHPEGEYLKGLICHVK